MRQLTYAERQTLLNALTVAANRFEENATTMVTVGAQTLAEQFRKQAAESRALVEVVEADE